MFAVISLCDVNVITASTIDTIATIDTIDTIALLLELDVARLHCLRAVVKQIAN